jgi:uncharacterized membrane protein
MKPKLLIACLLAAFVTAITVFLRVPIPKSGGYLNLGDIVIIFAGLYLGPRYGALVGGIGSAIADAVGFPIFVIPTLLIKGAEGALAGILPRRLRILGPILGAIAMVGGYFVAEAFIFSGKIGKAGAVAELPFNVLQGAVGVIGGFGIHVIMTRWLGEEAPDVRNHSSH